jgi:hypothetical protein
MIATTVGKSLDSWTFTALMTFRPSNESFIGCQATISRHYLMRQVETHYQGNVYHSAASRPAREAFYDVHMPNSGSSP